MKKKFHKVTIQVFVRKGEECLIDASLPISLSSFLATQFVKDQTTNSKIYSLPHAKLVLQEVKGFDEAITIYTFTFEKITVSNKIFETIMQNLSLEEQKEIRENVLSFVDEEGRLSLRLERQKLEKGIFTLTSGACVHYSFFLAAYPKNEETIRECALSLCNQ